MVNLRATMLKSATQFAEIWHDIDSLRAACDAREDVLLDPLHFLATTSSERRSSCSVACWSESTLIGVLFATQHLAWGLPTGYAIGGDYSGRGLILCRPEHEAAVIRTAVETLFAQGIHSLHLRMVPRTEEQLEFPALAVKQLGAIIPGDRLKLGSSYEEFLNTLGKHTRRNVRYYIRRANDAGIAFEPCLSEEEFRRERERLNKVTSYPVKRARMEEDDRLLALHTGSMRMGLRAADQTLVALLCGFSRGRRFHVLTQWNDPSLRKLSLSIVLRGNAAEYLIASGHDELQFMGGLSLTFGRFCPPSQYRSISLDRPRGMMQVAKRLAATYCLSRARASKRPSSTARTLSGGFLDDSILGERITLYPGPGAAISQAAAPINSSSKSR